MRWIDPTRRQNGRTAASTAKLPDPLRKSLYYPLCNFRWQANHNAAAGHPCTTCNDRQPRLQRPRGRQL